MCGKEIFDTNILSRVTLLNIEAGAEEEAFPEDIFLSEMGLYSYDSDDNSEKLDGCRARGGYVRVSYPEVAIHVKSLREAVRLSSMIVYLDSVTFSRDKFIDCSVIE